MCGIAGFIETRVPARHDELVGVLRCMTNSIQHRGPDDEGQWIDADVGVALGHRRLSIIDLSSAGHQPMISSSGRYVVVYNGEIYNHHQIREELLRHSPNLTFRGTSDTEVMLAAVECWGLKPALKRLNGMFAMAIWDRAERLLHLVRDRAGEKPLFYGWIGDLFLFGSELKALMAHPRWQGELNEHAMADYVQFGYMLAPDSVFRSISKVTPGEMVSVSLRPKRTENLQREYYWDPRERIRAAVNSPFEGSAEDAVEQLDALLRDSVKMRMEADVSLGAFLSGGIDSSTIVALMQAQSPNPIKTFSIGFWQNEYNEAPHAKAIANHLGTAHTELYVTPENALDLVSKLPSVYDEPFADASQIPTMLVAQLARREVTVSLSGDGGDELFGGYDRYRRGARIAAVIDGVPRSVRTAMASGLAAMPNFTWHTVDQLQRGMNKTKERVRKIQGLLLSSSFEEAYPHMMAQWDPSNVLYAFGGAAKTNDRQRAVSEFGATQSMMYSDLLTYLPDDILTKVDRATMAVSLEGRMPLLDHRVIEFAWSLPLAMKLRENKTKWVLRQVLHRYVPPALIDRPKMGFGIPIEKWLRCELREWATDLLSEATLRRSGIFNIGSVTNMLSEHLSGKRDFPAQLWTILMFQAWFVAHQSALNSTSEGVTAGVGQLV